MEENRLKPMPKGYDEKLFIELYDCTEGLRRKLAGQIDSRRFGVDYWEIYSWFTVKFIHTFNRYYNKKPNLLKGDIINSLQNFKCRILRSAYTVKYSQDIVRIGDTRELESIQTFSTEEEQLHDNRVVLIKSFMKQYLSDNAYYLLEILLNPPPYILHQIMEQEIPSLHKIPDELICDYLGLEDNDRGLKYINTLRKEIKNATNYATQYFKASQSNN